MNVRAFRVLRVSQFSQKQFEFFATPMHVPNQVERTMIVAPVGPHLSPLDRCGCDLLLASEYLNRAEALALQPAEGFFELRRMLAHNVGPELAVWTRSVALLADGGRQVENDDCGEHMELPSKCDEGPSALALNIGRVDDGEKTAGKALSNDEVE